MGWIAAGTLGILGPILYVPFVGGVFHMSRPHADDAVVVVVAGFGAFVWMEVVKLKSSGWLA